MKCREGSNGGEEGVIEAIVIKFKIVSCKGDNLTILAGYHCFSLAFLYCGMHIYFNANIVLIERP